MINKIAETHFNALRASLGSATGTNDTTHADLSSIHGALNTFLSTPSFSSKQIAIESLLKQITQGTLQS